MMNLKFNGLVLAGGRSSRMGQDKSLLIMPNGERLLDNAAQLLKSTGANQVFVNHPEAPEHAKISEPFPGRGPLSGIHGALNQTLNVPLLILPVDMPLMTVTALQALVAEAAQRQADLYFGQQCLPLFVFHVSTALQITTQLLETGASPAVWRLIDLIAAESLEVEHAHTFDNANDPEQWQECLQRLSNKSST